MGYELYRLLATRTQRKKRKTKKEAAGPVCIDIEEEDKEKLMLDGQYLSLLRLKRINSSSCFARTKKMENGAILR